MQRVMPICLVLCISLPLRAQPALDPGTRVRVYSVDSAVAVALRQALIGRVVRSRPDTLSLLPDASGLEVRLASHSLERIDVSAGRPTHAIGGGIVGGLISGGAFVALACAFSNGSCRIGHQVGGFLAYYATGAIPGAVVGAVVGSRTHGPERWRTIWVRSEPAGGRSDGLAR